ncbi:TPA: hypothetical protein ACH3X3_006318 [Trebouxia sp. C0006]
MADVQLHYLSKANTNFPSLTSPEQSRTEIAQTLECLNAEYLQLKQSPGKEARLVCDLSHNNLTYEHLQYLTAKLLASPVQLYALDLSWNRIFAATWPEVLPLVKQLLTKAMYVDLAGNYLPALLPEQLDLQDMLKQHVSFTAPNRYLGSTDWIRDWTSKAHEFRQKAYRSVYGPLTVYDCLGMPFTAAGCREEAEEGSDSD